MREANWALIYAVAPYAMPVDVNLPLAVHSHFTARHTLFADDQMFSELKNNWVPVATPDGINILYRRVR